MNLWVLLILVIAAVLAAMYLPSPIGWIVVLVIVVILIASVAGVGGFPVR